MGTIEAAKAVQIKNAYSIDLSIMLCGKGNCGYGLHGIEVRRDVMLWCEWLHGDIEGFKFVKHMKLNQSVPFRTNKSMTDLYECHVYISSVLGDKDIDFQIPTFCINSRKCKMYVYNDGVAFTHLTAQFAPFS